MEYKLITASRQSSSLDPVGKVSGDLEKKVNDAISDGYRPVGKVKIIFIKDNVCLMQQMIKE